MATKRRLENTTICCPIIVGSFAHLLLPASERKNYALLDKKGPDDLSTHEWTLFVRGPNGEDLSVFINKVVFQLHPSFPFPVREITSPPFEVTETGWGEFECGIRMFFKDPDEDPIDVSHLLKLYHTPTPGSTLAHLSKKPVVYEHYDEIVFTNPSEEFGKLLSQYVSPAEVPPHRLQDFFGEFSDDADVKKLTSISCFVMSELEASKTEYLRLEAVLAYLNSIKAKHTIVTADSKEKKETVKKEKKEKQTTTVSSASANPFGKWSPDTHTT